MQPFRDWSQREFAVQYMQHQQGIKRAGGECSDDDDDDNMPGLENVEGMSPQKSPKRPGKPDSVSKFAQKTLDEKERNEQVIETPEELEKRQLANSLSDISPANNPQAKSTPGTQEDNGSYDKDQVPEFYPKITDYLMGGKYNKLLKGSIFLKDSKKPDSAMEQNQAREEGDSRKIEQYLNKLFPEHILEEQELYDPRILEQEKDQNFAMNKLSNKIMNLTKKTWSVPQLISKLRSSYEKQAFYLSKISKLYADHLIHKNNLREKEKKIQDIQKVLRDLNEYKSAYLDLHKADKIDQLDIQYQEKYSNEINRLREQLKDITKERDSFKSKFTVFRDKYEEIFNEAKEAKFVIQEQVKELLIYKKECVLKNQKLQEELKLKINDENRKQSYIDPVQTKSIRNRQRKPSVASIRMAGNSNNIQEDHFVSASSIQNQRSFNNNSHFPSISQQGQGGQIGNIQSPQKPLQANKINNPVYPSSLHSYSHLNELEDNNDQLNANQTQGNDFYGQNSLSLRSSRTIDKFQEFEIAEQSQNQQKIVQQKHPTNIQTTRSQLATQFNDDSTQIVISSPLTDSKKIKKPQVQFEDMAKPTKIKDEDNSDDYFNQLCANKIKNMVKAISLHHPLLIEESSQIFRK